MFYIPDTKEETVKQIQQLIAASEDKLTAVYIVKLMEALHDK